MTKVAVSSVGNLHDSYLTIAQLAELLGCHPNTLARYRTDGGGPRFCRVGRKILYRKADVYLWLEECSYNSTAEYGRPKAI